MAKPTEDSSLVSSDIAALPKLIGWTPAKQAQHLNPVATLEINIGNTNVDIGRSSMEGGKREQRRQVANRIVGSPVFWPLDDSTKGINLTSSLPLKSPNVVPVISRKARFGAEAKRAVHRDLVLSLEDDDTYVYDSTTLSDFIVDDSLFLAEHDLDLDMAAITPHQRRTRKLVRGTRPDHEQLSEGEDREQEQPKIPNATQPIITPRKETRPPMLNLADRGNNNSVIKSGKCMIELSDRTTSSSVNEQFVPNLSPWSNKSPLRDSRESRVMTPPTSPLKKRTGLISPKKCPRIPLTPHRPSTDKFWSQDVVNEWNDEFSPRKPPKSRSEVIERDEYRDYLPRKTLENGSTKPNLVTLKAKKSFRQRKHEIAEAFLAELDDSITAGKITAMTASTGGVTIVWSKKLNTTAGRANWRREALKTISEPADGSTNATYKHYASIELAEKVIDDEVRLLNVIAHEFCHLANFMVSDVKNNPHGKEFKTWAGRCTQRFGNRGIEVTTKHSYDIDYKYVWGCKNCGLEFKRHSKSINPAKHQCSLCKGKLIQKKPMPRTNRTTNEYQMFVKENMKRIKQENPGSPQKDIMGIVGKKYQEYKASKLIRGGEEVSKVDTSIEKVPGSRGAIISDTGVDTVIRKLDLLDLTSP